MPRKIIISLILFTTLLSACASEVTAENDTVDQVEDTSDQVTSVEETSVVVTIEPTEEEANLDRVEFISADGTILVGKVDLPNGEGPFPAFVYVQGSGFTTRDQGGGSVVPALIEAGYALLRYDKRGVGESGGDYSSVGPRNSELILGQLAQDARAGADFLSQLDVIDPSRIGLFGNSQAGWIIPAAAEDSEVIAYAVILVGPTVSVGEENYYSSLTQENSATLTEEKLIAVSEDLATYSGVKGFDPRPSIETLDIPVLWVLGGRDASIPTKETVEILEEIIAEFAKNFTVHVYPLGTHGLQNVETGERINFMDEVVLGWIEDRIGLNP